MIAPERRALRRRLGPVAWCVLEDLVEDARVDSLGRRVATSSVRRLADNLGVSKDTTARALRRLTSAQLIEALPAPRVDRGRFGVGAYLICAASPRDSAMAVERAAAPPESRRPRARSSAVSQPTLFDAAVDPGATACESAPGAAEVGVGTDRDAGRGDAEAGVRTEREEAGREEAGREEAGREEAGREEAGREEAGRESEAPGRRAAG